MGASSTDNEHPKTASLAGLCEALAGCRSASGRQLLQPFAGFRIGGGHVGENIADDLRAEPVESLRHQAAAGVHSRCDVRPADLRIAPLIA